MQIKGTTRLTGIFGCPVKHTISPLMHNAAFSKCKLDLVYLPFLVAPDELETAVKALDPLGFLGINVTVPHKQTIIPFLDELSKEAELIGAVNTVLVRDGKLIGYNTDGIGFVKSLGNLVLKGKTMFVLGAGGAGYAVAVQSALRGLKRVYICDTIAERAQRLCERVPGGKALVSELCGEVLEESDIIVNATPIGLNPKDSISIPERIIPRGKLVCDLIYNPVETKLLKAAKKRGCKVLNGLGMLLHQGAASFEIWTGKKAPIDIMQKAVSGLTG